eukprot:GDKK01052323.1.p1 GENE.GDKK01052323.1~~GDKK01052323.1.p1  ORF type:complete len:480 (-),score=86.09 GDKK01052323.1:359-1798(-)
MGIQNVMTTCPSFAGPILTRSVFFPFIFSDVPVGASFAGSFDSNSFSFRAVTSQSCGFDETLQLSDLTLFADSGAITHRYDTSFQSDRMLSSVSSVIRLRDLPTTTSDASSSSFSASGLFGWEGPNGSTRLSNGSFFTRVNISGDVSGVVHFSCKTSAGVLSSDAKTISASFRGKSAYLELAPYYQYVRRMQPVDASGEVLELVTPKEAPGVYMKKLVAHPCSGNELTVTVTGNGVTKTGLYPKEAAWSEATYVMIADLDMTADGIGSLEVSLAPGPGVTTGCVINDQFTYKKYVGLMAKPSIAFPSDKEDNEPFFLTSTRDAVLETHESGNTYDANGRVLGFVSEDRNTLYITHQVWFDVPSAAATVWLLEVDGVRQDTASAVMGHDLKKFDTLAYAYDISAKKDKQDQISFKIHSDIKCASANSLISISLSSVSSNVAFSAVPTLGEIYPSVKTFQANDSLMVSVFPVLFIFVVFLR